MVLTAAQAFAEARNQQIDKLVVLRGPDNHAAFELRDGVSQLGDMLAGVPNASALVKDWLALSLMQPHGIAPDGRPDVGLTVGDLRHMVAQATGTMPFPEGELTRYLKQYQVEDKPDTPVEE